MKLGIALATILLVTGCASLNARKPARIPESWVARDPIRRPHAYTAMCKGWWAWHLRLSRDSTRVFLVSAPPPFPRRDSLRVSGGRLEGWDGGEFSGGIEWHPDHGVTEAIIEENLVSFVNLSGRILALVGLAHLSSDRGYILELNSAGGRWTAKRLADLGSVPTAYTFLSGDRVLIGTMKSVLSFQVGEEPRVLYKNDVYPWLGGSSIVSDRAGVIYLMTRGFVTRLRPVKGGYRTEWLIPPSCNGVSPRFVVGFDIGSSAEIGLPGFRPRLH